MKKEILLIIPLFVLLSLSFVYSLDLNVSPSLNKNNTGQLFIIGLKSPAVYDTYITNKGPSDNFKIYSYFGSNIEPKNIFIKNGETKEVKIKVYPGYNSLKEGSYFFSYFIKASDGTSKKVSLLVRNIKLGNSLKVLIGDININSTKMNLTLVNDENFEFKNIKINFLSNFINTTNLEEISNISISPFKEKSFLIPLNREAFKEIGSGFYSLEMSVSSQGQSSSLQGNFNYLPKSALKMSNSSFGFFIDKQIVSKENEGNLNLKTQTILRRGIISRLFTTSNPTPDITQRKGGEILYIWNYELAPGEKKTITLETNWLIPLIFFILLIGLLLIIKKYSEKDLEITKKVSYVHTKGKEFALKITLLVHSRKEIGKISIIDKTPSLFQVYEKFLGGKAPSKIDQTKKRIYWNLEKLEEGEFRIFTYVIYSKIGISGKFSLPLAIGVFEKDEKIKEIRSNKTFFIINETPKKRA